MNYMSNEAMKLALRALELEDMACRYEKEPTPEHIAKAITALQDALADQPTPPPECQTEAEKAAYAYGWWKALEQAQQDLIKSAELVRADERET